MSLDKAIEHHKEHRKPYYDNTKRDDKTCRNHGSDDWARDNRLYRSNKLLEKSEHDLDNFIDEIDFTPKWSSIEVTLEITNVSKFVPSIELDEIEDCVRGT